VLLSSAWCRSFRLISHRTLLGPCLPVVACSKVPGMLGVRGMLSVPRLVNRMSGVCTSLGVTQSFGRIQVLRAPSGFILLSWLIGAL
jgi:hypothetical protein